MTFILAFSVGLGIGEHQRNFFRDSDWCYVYSPTGESIAVPLKSSPTMKRFADELLAVCKSKAKKGRDRTKPPAQFVFNVHRGLEPKAPLVFSVWYYPTDQLVDCYIEGTGSVALSLREEFQTEVKSFFARPASEIPSLIASLEFFPESFTHYRCLALEALGKQGKKSNE